MLPSIEADDICFDNERFLLFGIFHSVTQLSAVTFLSENKNAYMLWSSLFLVQDLTLL